MSVIAQASFCYETMNISSAARRIYHCEISAMMFSDIGLCDRLLVSCSNSTIWRNFLKNREKSTTKCEEVSKKNTQKPKQ